MTHKPITKVGIITKHHLLEKPENLRLLKKLVSYLKSHNQEIFFDTNAAPFFKSQTARNGPIKKSEILKNVDMAITLGGDGTILKTARSISQHKVLMFPVNLGNVGFLTETNPNKLFATLDLVFDDKYVVDKRSLLRATLYRKGKKICTYLALNDAVINQGAFARLITIDLEVNGRRVVKFKADGVIISTPTGSTAHSLSAGGPIVHPGIEGLIITPICPSSLSMRSIVVPGTRQITITIETERRAEDISTIGLTIDGQDPCMLKYGDEVKVRRSRRYLYIIRTKNRYYKILRQKLNWGEE
ncbi:NAD(+)/NADH kinase [Candidatus Peregrinibacteria bacterium]|nr:NAD(+)/NADH kinase [Candidatus Peregrinibacteria bacterium]